VGLRGIFITSATITDNTAVQLGGGMYITQDSSITSQGAQGQAQVAGSSSSASAGQVQLARSTLSRNTALFAGGGIYFIWDTGLNITSCNTSATRTSVTLYSSAADATVLAPCSDWVDNTTPRGYGEST
jgi:hypothetical protein